jgi:glyoxylase-like metal-dependent hydrolase (beta-lactamase superfamily II)
MISLALLIVTVVPSSGVDPLFDLKPVVDGVYAAIARPVSKTNCNSAVILLDDAVMVVDAQSKPSSARALMEQIGTITNKPIRYVFNTHFHWDHAHGNRAYLEAGALVIASEATREAMLARAPAHMQFRVQQVPTEIENLRANLAKAPDQRRSERIQDLIRQNEAYASEMKGAELGVPNWTFERHLTIRQKVRTVQIIAPGKAHTDGDAIVYLPNEKVIITGDLLHGLMPYMGDSYPYDWIRVLGEVQNLDFEYVIGGHGDVIRGKERFRIWKDYLTDLMAEAAQAYAKGLSLEAASKAITAKLEPKYSGKLPPPNFSGAVGRNIQKAYRVVSGIQE